MLRGSPNAYTLSSQVRFQFWYAYFSEMKHAGRQCCIGFSSNKGIAKMLLDARTARCNDWYAELVGQTRQSLVGIAPLNAVVVHGRKQYLSRPTVACLSRPFEQIKLHWYAPSIQIAAPTF